MINLYPVFQDHALFLHSSPLTVSGTALPGKNIHAKITKNGRILSEGSSVSENDGGFGVILNTPAASFDTYEISVSDGNDTVVISDVLFGELWLASGQSNMEMTNSQQNEFEKYFDSLQGKNMRFYLQNRNPGGQSGQYPFEPDYTMGGKWITVDKKELVGRVSACATAFCSKLYDFLNSGKGDTPIGFLNSSVGGTPIEAWLPMEVCENDRDIRDYLEKTGKYPFKDTWNKKGNANYQQTCCLYNQLIAPHTGAKCRGVIWYQGEGNCAGEYGYRIYAKLLKALRESYKKLLAPKDDEVFPIISSMIYPWTYGPDGETNIGYLNKAFSDLAESSPAEFPFIPICDLSPIWAFHAGNHPIHPIHKYPLGERMALLCANSVYGRKVPNAQKLPAMLKSCIRKENTLCLTFTNTGSGLYIKGNKVRGLYICGKNEVYVPAECRITGTNTMTVYHPFIKNPVHVAYAISSYEVETNLFAGEFPVSPFFTQSGVGENPVKIFLKPWLNTEYDSEFICNFKEERRDVFRQPIYRPSPGSTVCFDRDFSISGRSVRVGGIGETFGTYIISNPYNPIDLQNYSALHLCLLNINGLNADIVLNFAEKGGNMVITGEMLSTLPGGWGKYVFDLTAVPDLKIDSLEFRFTLKNNPLYYVNIDSLFLVPKE